MDLSVAVHAALTQDRPRADWDRGCLSGARCTACGTSSWPARSVCYGCGSANLEAVRFAATGSLLTYTSVWVPRPGLEVPYTLGQVHIDDGPVVFAHVRGLPEGATVPCPVRLVLSGDPSVTPWYWYEPVEAAGARSSHTQDPDAQDRPSHG